MGVSASSLLDEAKSSYIKGQAEEQLKEFSPYYTKQFSVAWFSQLEDELVQNKEKITQLLQQKVPPEDGEVLYEESVLYFDDTRKWRERYVVVRANYRLECHDSLETFVKGVPPFHTLLPTGGTVVTTEEAYMAMVDKCFPGDSSVKEDFAPPQSGMPGEFLVFLRLPYRRDSYFCFRQEAKQAAFISILSDCIRHQNQDFLKKKTCEVQAFRKAIQLYRQDKDKYESWDMLIGSDVRVMANLVMEELLPSLGNDMLPRLKAKKTEKKRVWFATMEEAYILIQESLLEGLLALKEECRTSVRQQEVLIHSDMDQILNTRRQLEEKIRAKVSEPAERLCSESVQPYLGSVLEEMMEPISSGFLEGRQQSETMMDQVCQDILQGVERDKLNKTLADMAKPNLLSCYQKINLLQDKLHHLQERFSFSNITSVIHSAQIDLQQLMENAAYTFEQLLYKAIEDNPENIGSVFEKVKHRVLKQFDYDSSTMRKRIFQDTLVSVTLPFIKKNLAPTCKTELQGLEQTIYADYSNFIHVENVYENILLDILDKEVSRVVKEAASLNKHNLFADSSRSSLSSSSVSTPNSPALTVTSPRKTTIEALPPSPLVRNGLPPSLQTEQEEEEGDVFLQSEASSDLPARETPLGRVEQKEEAPRVAELPATKAEEVQTVKEEAGSSDQLETKGSAETNLLSEKDEVSSVQTEGTQTAAEPRIQRADDLQGAKITLSQTPPTDVERLKSEAPDPSAEPVKLPAEEPQPPTSSEETPQSEKSEVKLEAPSSGEEADAIRLKQEESESVTASYPNSLDVSVGSESPPSDLESTGDVSNISDVLEVVQTPESPEETAEDKATSEEPETSEEPSAEVQTEAGSARNEVEAGASMNVETSAEPQDTTSSSSPPSPDTRPPDCVKEIRDLVVEVIEVEEMLQHYPKEG